MPLFRRKKEPKPELEKGLPINAVQPMAEIGRQGPIGKQEVQEAEQTLKDYKAGKANLENRIIENEQWYKLRHWEQIRSAKGNPGDPEPASA